MKELCFKLIKKEIEINEEKLIDSFIDFAIKNKVSVSGNLNQGFCFCKEGSFLPKEIKKNLIDFLSKNYFMKFNYIQFEEFNEMKNYFIKKEIVKLDDNIVD